MCSPTVRAGLPSSVPSGVVRLGAVVREAEWEAEGEGSILIRGRMLTSVNVLCMACHV